MRRRRFLVAGSLLLIANALSAAVTDQAGKAKTPLDAFLEGLQGFSAAFKQEVTNERGEKVEDSAGVVYMQRPGRFQWAYWEPYKQTIVSDGMTLWIYDEDLEQVTVKDAVESVDDSPAEVLGGFVDVNERYVVNDLGETGGVRWLELTPRNIESQYQSVRLGFRDGQLAGMTLFDNLGQRTGITFTDVKRNPDLKEDIFKFTPPAGVDVIDTRGAPPPAAP